MCRKVVLQMARVLVLRTVWHGKLEGPHLDVRDEDLDFGHLARPSIHTPVAGEEDQDDGSQGRDGECQHDVTLSRPLALPAPHGLDAAVTSRHGSGWLGALGALPGCRKGYHRLLHPAGNREGR